MDGVFIYQLRRSGGRTESKVISKVHFRTSSQDGGVGRHTVPPHTNKRRTTTNLKTKNTQNRQKIKLYGSPTTKELKKKQGGDRQLGGEDLWQGSSWWTQ